MNKIAEGVAHENLVVPDSDDEACKLIVTFIVNSANCYTVTRPHDNFKNVE